MLRSFSQMRHLTSLLFCFSLSVRSGLPLHSGTAATPLTTCNCSAAPGLVWVLPAHYDGHILAPEVLECAQGVIDDEAFVEQDEVFVQQFSLRAKTSSLASKQDDAVRNSSSHISSMNHLSVSSRSCW